MREIIVPAEKNSLYPILDFVRQFAGELGVREELFQIELAVEEVFTNIFSYAYENEGGMVSVVCEAAAAGEKPVGGVAAGGKNDGGVAAGGKPVGGVAAGEKTDGSVEKAEGKLRISFMDTGIPHNPLEHGDPDITLSAALRPMGGLGIFLIKEFMDNVFYEYREGRNILTIEKLL